MYPPPPFLSRASLRFALLLSALAFPLAAHAQPDAAGPTATLSGWSDAVRTAVRDRRHAYGGLFFDRGIFRRLTPGMDHEYDLDLLTYGFTPDEDARWYASNHALRTFMGSIHRSRFATQTRFRHRVAVGARHAILLDGMQQEDLTAQRFFVEAGYGYRLGRHHHIGFSQTVAAYKPDLDLSLFYAFDHAAAGLLRVELGLLDVANDLIFDVLGADPVLEDTVRSYRRAPRLFALTWHTPVCRGFRAEVAAGIQPTARADVHSQRRTDLRFRWADRLAYAGGLFEYRHARVTTGLLLRHTFSRAARRSAPGARDATDYTTTQTDWSATAYALAPLPGLPVSGLQAGLWLTAETYADVQRGTAFGAASIPSAMDYRERRLLLHARLHRLPARRGRRAGLDYYGDGRTFARDETLMARYLTFLPWSPNGRLAFHAGYQVSPAVYVLAGAAYDTGGDPFYGDGRGPIRYDGGFGRLFVTW